LARSHAASVELIANGEFEDPIVPAVGYLTFSDGNKFSGWTVSSGDVDLVGTNYFASAFGPQCLDLNGNGGGQIYQDITTTPGANYRLSFAFAGNPVRRVGEGPPLKKMELRWGTNVLATLEHDVTLHSAENVGWRRFSYLILGTGRDRLLFRSLTAGNAGPAIDQVSIVPADTPVPLAEGLDIEKAVQLSFPTLAGKVYQLEWASKTDTNVWNLLGSPVLGNGNTNLFYDVVSNAPLRFYRLLEVGE
jgi:choice-of-anchor C domain-containing protein